MGIGFYTVLLFCPNKIVFSFRTYLILLTSSGLYNTLIYNDNLALCTLNKNREYRKFFLFQIYSLLNQSKSYLLHVISGIKLYKKELKMALMNRLKCSGLSQHPRAGKIYNDGSGLLLHKLKDAGVQ